MEDQLALDGQVLRLPPGRRARRARRRRDRRPDLGGRRGAAHQLLLRRPGPHPVDRGSAIRRSPWWSSSWSPDWSAGRSRSRSGAPRPPSGRAPRPRPCRRWPVRPRGQEDSLRDVLKHARETFRHGVGGAQGPRRRRAANGWTPTTPDGGRPAMRRRCGSTSRRGRASALVGRGPALFAEDERVLEAFAAAARTAYEGRRLSGKAEEARTLATVDEQRRALLAAVGHDLRTPLAGIKASVSSLRQTDVEWSEDEEREALLETIEESSGPTRGRGREPPRRQPAAVRGARHPPRAGRARSGGLLGGAASAGGAGPRSSSTSPRTSRWSSRSGAARARLRQRDRQRLRHGASDEPDHDRRPRRIGHGEDRGGRPRSGGRRGARERLFEPSSASDTREGLGLGLSVARGFVEAMDGALVADDTRAAGDDADPAAARALAAEAASRGA